MSKLTMRRRLGMALRNLTFRQKTGLRIAILALLIVLQGASLLFFLGDVVADFMAIGFDPHTRVEALATLALLLGVVLGAVELARTLRQVRRSEAALRMASGAFTELLAERFDEWGLTGAEAEVALFTLKGFDPVEIAGLRDTAAGTVRVQQGRIYAKSGSAGRGQFVSLFIDELLDTSATTALRSGTAAGSRRETPRPAP